MKGFRGMERSLRIVSVLVALSAIDILHNQRSVLSQPMYPKAGNSVDFICYIQTKEGQVINLSNLCANRRFIDGTTSALSRVDQQFLQSYQGFLQKRAKISPGVQAVLSQSQQNPRSVFDRAKAVCSGMGAGQSQSTSDQVTDYLFQAMASKQYCPKSQD